MWLLHSAAQEAKGNLADEGFQIRANHVLSLIHIWGELTPMFFGSAVTNFGVEPFLERFLQYTPPPLPRKSDLGMIGPEEPYFSGFIFKIQANMNPAHRDRLAFMRIVSGAFEKGMEVWHSGTGKQVALKQPQQFMADEREAVEEAWAGDIIGCLLYTSRCV